MKKTTKKKTAPAKKPVKPDVRGELYEWAISLVTALVACILVFIFILHPVDVDGDSMNNTLYDGDKMIVSNLFYTPKQGDIVVFRKDEYKSEALVKRVIATEGQTVEIDFDKGIVYVDDKALDEPYTADYTYIPLDFSGIQTVPEGCVFVMGDNRNRSTDSRKAEIGMVDTRLILGKAVFIMFPLDRIGSPYGD